MSSSKSPRTICLPAHILNARISPRAREVLMLLASQTTAQSPTLWVCHGAIAKKLHCSPITVKRAIEKLAESSLIVETGDLHERRYKFYRVRWSLDEQVAVAPKAKKKETKQEPTLRPTLEHFEQLTLPPVEIDMTPDRSIIPNDSLIARHMAMAQQRNQEILRRYNINEHTIREASLSY